MISHGLFGFYYKHKYYLSYNYSESQYSFLGKNLVNEIKLMLIHDKFDKWCNMLENITIIENLVGIRKQPSKYDIKILEPYSDWNQEMIVEGFHDSTDSTDPTPDKDWYLLLYKTQGSFMKVLQSGYIINHDKESCNIDYIYILDFDNKQFIVNDICRTVYSFDKLPNW